MAGINKKLKIFFPGFFLLFINSINTRAQSPRTNDTSYYVFFPGSITARLYTSQKYTVLNIKPPDAKNISYHPNTSFNLGAGITYHNLSLKLGYGFGFLNKDSAKGKTKYLDLQTHIYSPKWITDLYGQLYKGYHLYPEGLAAEPGKDYYYRGDIRVSLFGISLFHVFNYTRFSYRAAFVQNEWQKKSAGTFLAGAETFYGIVKADSNLIPRSIANNNTDNNINKINYFSIGPGVGYAYTEVLLQHIFFTGSLTGNLNFILVNDHAKLNNGSRFSINPSTRFRVSTGYNGRTWNVSANWVSGYLPFKGTDKERIYIFNTGNYRFIVAKRFNTGSRLQKHLKLVNKILKE